MTDTTNSIQIIISAHDKASQAIKQTSDSMKEAEKSAGGFKESFSALSKGIATGAGLITGEIVMLKKAFSFGKEGAEIIQLHDSFENLTERVGVHIDVLKEMQRTTRGTVDDEELLAVTMRLTSGMTDDLTRAMLAAAPQLTAIAKAATALNPTLGTTGQLYENIAMGIRRGRAATLVQAGLMVNQKKAYEDYAETLGITADALSEDEQAMALLNEALRAGDVLIQNAGEGAASAVDPFNRLEVAAGELGDTLKERVAPFLTRAAEAAELLLTWHQKLGDAADEHTSWAENEAATYDDYVAAMRRVLAVTDKGTADIIDMMEANNSLAFAIQNMVDAGIIMDQETWQWKRGLMELTEASKGAQRAFGRTGDAIETEAQQMARLKLEADRVQEGLDELSTLMGGAVGREMRGYHEAMAGLVDEATDLRLEIAELEGKRYLTEEQRAELDELKLKLGETTTEMGELRNETTLAMKQIIFDMSMARLAADGLSEDEYTFMAGLAERFGLIDKQTAEMATNIDKALGELATGSGAQDALEMLDGLVKKSEQALQYGGGTPMEVGERMRRLGAIQEERGGGAVAATFAVPVEVTHGWEVLRGTIVETPNDWATAASGMQRGTDAYLTQGESIKIKMGDIQTAREEALPRVSKSSIEIENEDQLLETLATAARLVREMTGDHTVNFKVTGNLGAVAAASPIPGAPAPATRPTPMLPTQYRASGTDYAVGGLTWLNENGPELVVLPTGSQVVPHHEVHQMGAGTTNNFNLTVHTTRELFSVRHEFEVMTAMGGM